MKRTAAHADSRARRVRAALAACALAGLSSLLGFEANVPSRVARRLDPLQHPWLQADTAALSAMESQTRLQLLKSDAPEQVQVASTSRIERLWRDARNPTPANNWANGLLAYGLLVTDEARPTPANGDELDAFLGRVVTPDGTFAPPLDHVQQALVGVVLLDRARRPGNPAAARAAATLFDYLLLQHPKSPTGTLLYNPGLPDHLLVDTLGMACPFLARAAAEFGRPEGFDLATLHLAEFLDRAIDPATGLPWHAYASGGGPAYGLLGWTRGAGWLGIGLVETLRYLPANHPRRPRLVAGLRALTEAVAPRQLPDGLWRWCLSIPEGDPDTSGTAMLAWTLLRGVELGLLDMRDRTTAMAAMTGVVRQTDQHGRVGQALGECQAVGNHPRVFGAYPWSQGPATAALALGLRSAPESAGLPPRPKLVDRIGSTPEATKPLRDR